MNKVILTAVAVLVLITGGVLLVIMDDSSADLNNSQNAQIVETPEPTTDVESNQQVENIEQLPQEESASGLGYVEYSDTVLADSSGSKQILFFHAPWCSVCNFFEGQIEEQGVPENITVVKIDFDSETELKNQYGVNVQSTFVLLDSNGDVEQTWPFAQGLKSIQDLYDQV